MIKLDKINIDEALRYMGYKIGQPLEQNVQELLEKCESELLSAINPRYIYKLFEIESHDEGIAIKNTRVSLTGNSIVKHLDGCDRIIILAATLSSNVDKLINKYQVTDMSCALMVDAMASSAIEQVCDEAEKEFNFKYRTWRFSPGYGDLPISLQAPLLALVDAPKRIGLTVNENNLMLPIKSVSAIIGISDKPIEKRLRGCAACSMNKICEFRKRGTHCGI